MNIFENKIENMTHFSKFRPRMTSDGLVTNIIEWLNTIINSPHFKY